VHEQTLHPTLTHYGPDFLEASSWPIGTEAPTVLQAQSLGSAAFDASSFRPREPGTALYAESAKRIETRLQQPDNAPVARVTAQSRSGDDLYLADLQMIDFRQRQPEQRELLGCP
jgi:hypothetical protein